MMFDINQGLSRKRSPRNKMNNINIDPNESAVQLCEVPQKREAARNPDVLLWQNSMC